MPHELADLPPTDDQLPAPVVRLRRKWKRTARIMLSIAIGTAIVGWALFGSSLFSALKIREQPPSLAIIAYALLIISSVTLVLGLWYLLLAQVQALARMVDADELESGSPPVRTEPLCPHCARPHEAADRFCRHCGQRLIPAVNEE